MPIGDTNAAYFPWVPIRRKSARHFLGAACAWLGLASCWDFLDSGEFDSDHRCYGCAFHTRCGTRRCRPLAGQGNSSCEPATEGVSQQGKEKEATQLNRAFPFRLANPRWALLPQSGPPIVRCGQTRMRGWVLTSCRGPAAQQRPDQTVGTPSDFQDGSRPASHRQHKDINHVTKPRNLDCHRQSLRYPLRVSSPPSQISIPNPASPHHRITTATAP